MEKVSKGILQEILILDNLNMEKLTAKECILGKTVRFMMENGIKE
jgi:hypothetical protein